jgi:hypothetical protein
MGSGAAALEDRDIMGGDGNEPHGRIENKLTQADIALARETVDRRLTLSADSLWRDLLSHGGGFRPNGNSRTARDGDLRDRDDAVLSGHSAQGRVAIR